MKSEPHRCLRKNIPERQPGQAVGQEHPGGASAEQKGAHMAGVDATNEKLNKMSSEWVTGHTEVGG